jgi:hypothetical protein
LLTLPLLEPVSLLSWPESMPPLMRPDLSNYTVAHSVTGSAPGIKAYSGNTSRFKGQMPASANSDAAFEWRRFFEAFEFVLRRFK